MNQTAAADLTSHDALLESAWACIIPAAEDALAQLRPLLDADQPRAAAFAWLFARLIGAAAIARLGDRGQARRWLDDVERALPSASLNARESLRITALANGVGAMLCYLERDLARALGQLNDALSKHRDLPPLDRHYLHQWRAMVHMGLANPERAFKDFFAEYDYVRLQHPQIFAVLALNLGAVLVHTGDWQGAESSTRQALAAEPVMTMRGFGVVCRCNLAYCMLHMGRREEARQLMIEAMRIDRDYVHQRHPGDLLATIAESLIETGLLDDAATYLHGTLADAAARNYRLTTATALWCAGRMAALRGDAVDAKRQWRGALLGLRHLPHVPHLWKTLRAVAELYAAQGDWRRAYRWQRRFQRAYVQWSSALNSARLAYAREQLELRSTREQAIRDPVTGLYNRRELVPRLDQAIDTARLNGSALVVGMIDLDNLKPINDRFGHLVGDDAITYASEHLLASVPPEALLFRYGGDEFCALLPGADAGRAHTVLGAYLALLRHWRPPDSEERRAPLSASIGLAIYPADGDTADRLLDAADTALYRAKKAGGNRIA
jgi:diguanylate cyclase (GGDEF)-like protein